MDFVYVTLDWHIGESNPTSKHRIALAASELGHRMLWMETAGMRRPQLGGATGKRDFGKLIVKLKKSFRPVREVVPNVWVKGPLAIPMPDKKAVRVFNARYMAHHIRRLTRQLGFEQPVLLNNLPTMDQLPRLLRYPSIYHCVDRWDAFEQYDSELMRELDATCCRDVDLVLATSRDLVSRCAEHNPNVKLFSHGVDHGHFAQALAPDVPRPADLPPGPVIGFFGMVEPYIDLELLGKLADAMPQAQVVIIGGVGVDVSALDQRPNVHFLGLRLFKNLPQYVAHFTVGLIPFIVNELTIAVNPIKLREMLAAGCPVVSSDLPEMKIYPQVDIAGDHDAFVTAVKRYIEQPLSQAQRQGLSDQIKDETWTARVQQLVAYAEELRK